MIGVSTITIQDFQIRETTLPETKSYQHLFVLITIQFIRHAMISLANVIQCRILFDLSKLDGIKFFDLGKNLA